MNTGASFVAKNICILIPTYRRNDLLLRLIEQTVGFMATYRGPNRYALCVTDSDPQNPLANDLRQMGIGYYVNPGKGFDENLYHFYAGDHGYDYIYSISDDDLFYPAATNPLSVLDAAVAMEKDAVMFNHRGYTSTANPSDITILPESYYRNPLMSGDNTLLITELLTLLPRHVGLLYATAPIHQQLEVLAQFGETLHLYAVPAILALVKGSIEFCDYDLCLFRESEGSDGAWANWNAVFHGLKYMLKAYQPILPAAYYQVAEQGFMQHYLGDTAWLRKLVAQKHALPDEREVRQYLAAVPTA